MSLSSFRRVPKIFDCWVYSLIVLKLYYFSVHFNRSLRRHIFNDNYGKYTVHGSRNRTKAVFGYSVNTVITGARHFLRWVRIPVVQWTGSNVLIVYVGSESKVIRTGRLDGKIKDKRRRHMMKHPIYAFSY